MMRSAVCIGYDAFQQSPVCAQHGLSVTAIAYGRTGHVPFCTEGKLFGTLVFHPSEKRGVHAGGEGRVDHLCDR